MKFKMSSKIFLLSEYIAVRGIIRTLLKNSFKVLVSGYLTNLIHGLVNLFQAVYNFRVCFFCFFFLLCKTFTWITNQSSRKRYTEMSHFHACPFQLIPRILTREVLVSSYRTYAKIRYIYIYTLYSYFPHSFYKM